MTARACPRCVNTSATTTPTAAGCSSSRRSRATGASGRARTAARSSGSACPDSLAGGPSRPYRPAMRVSRLGLSALAIATAAATAGFVSPADGAERPDPRIVSGGMAGVVHAKGATSHARPGSSPNLLFHNGAIMTSTFVQPIFWGTSWAGYTGDKMSGIDNFYGGIGGTSYLKTNSEYSGTNGKVGTGVASANHLVDFSAAPSGAPQTSAILAEVAKKITNPVSNGYYAVYVDTPRGHAGYCAWHSYGTGVDRTTPIQVAFFFNLDGDAGCDPRDTSGLHSQGLAALANVSGHELSEARTDPRNGGWYDSKGAENGDKCAWTFGAPLVTLSDGSKWKIQGEWSNAAFNAGTGYANNSGQRGCLGGL